MAPEVGFEPTTLRLTVACSTIELLRIVESGLQLVNPVTTGFSSFRPPLLFLTN